MGNKYMKNWQKEILKYGELYEVGGAVRDKLINPKLKIKDTDYLVTNIPMKKLIKLLKQFGSVQLVGKSFGIIKFIPVGGNIIYDIALPRQEYSIGVGHRDFVVKYDHRINIEEDMKRRDFTINAIAYNLRTKKYIDPLNGISDLKKRLIRMITEKSFIDDPLRMLRAVQFAARFNYRIEPKTLNAIKKYSSLVSTVSAERIQEELVKLLTKSKRPSIGLEIMSKTGLLKKIIPELESGKNIKQNIYHKYDIMRHNFYTCDATPQDNINLRLAGLLHDIGKVKTKKKVKGKTGKIKTVFYSHEELSAKLAERILTRLKFSNNTIKKVCHLIKNHMFIYDKEWTDSAVRRFIKRVGVENIEDLFLLRKADRVANGKKKGFDTKLQELYLRIKKELSKKTVLDLKDLAVNGNDVMRVLNIPPGPTVGRILQQLLNLVIENPSLNTRSNLLKKINVLWELSQNKISTGTFMKK